MDDSGQVPNWEYSYDIVYKYTSRLVHATSVALASQIGYFFTNSNFAPVFKFSKASSPSNGDNVVVNVCVCVQASVEHVFHAFDMPVPIAVREESEGGSKRWDSRPFGSLRHDRCRGATQLPISSYANFLQSDPCDSLFALWMRNLREVYNMDGRHEASSTIWDRITAICTLIIAVGGLVTLILAWRQIQE
jgi:hypothetical protein